MCDWMGLLSLNSLPVPDKTKISVRDGAWSSWECSTDPGASYGKAIRQCNNPAPDGGEDCPPGPSIRDDCLMLHREERGNPYNYFEKTFREYQNGFARNGVNFFSIFFFAMSNVRKSYAHNRIPKIIWALASWLPQSRL